MSRERYFQAQCCAFGEDSNLGFWGLTIPCRWVVKVCHGTRYHSEIGQGPADLTILGHTLRHGSLALHLANMRKHGTPQHYQRLTTRLGGRVLHGTERCGMEGPSVKGTKKTLRHGAERYTALRQFIMR
jgi:hypothetical protein